MSKYPRAVVASKYGNRPLIEVPAVSIPRSNQSAGFYQQPMAPMQYNQSPLSLQQPIYGNQMGYPTLQQQPYMPQYVSPAPVPEVQPYARPPMPVQQQQYIPPAPLPIPPPQPQLNRHLSNIANNSNFVPYVESAQIPQTQQYGGQSMPNLPNYNMPNGTNNGMTDEKGEMHHFYGPDGNKIVPNQFQNLSRAWGGHFQQPNYPTNFIIEGTVEYGQLTKIKLKDTSLSFREIPEFLLNELKRSYRNSPKTKIKVVAARGEINIYSTPIDGHKNHKGYVYEPYQEYHSHYQQPVQRPTEEYHRRPLQHYTPARPLEHYTPARPVEHFTPAQRQRPVTHPDDPEYDPYTKRYSREGVEVNDARKRWNKLKNVMTVVKR